MCDDRYTLIEVYGPGVKWLADSMVERVPNVGERIEIVSKVAPADIRATGRYRVVDVITRCFDESANQPSSGIYVMVDELEDR